MSVELVGALGIMLMLILIFFKVWIGAAMMLIGFLGYAYLSGWDNALYVVSRVPYSTTAWYPMTAIPLFIFMGTILSQTGVSGDLFNTANKWLGRLPGGLAIATVGTSAAFAAVSGSSTATAATMGKVAYPEMEKHGYDVRLATGTIAAGGTMGILIPPSMGFILYGILAQVSIGHLFIAGIIPGLLEAVFYMGAILVMCIQNPALGPPAPKSTFLEKLFSLKNTWAMFTLFILIMGGIYMGVFTPTEAGAIGAFMSLVITALSRKISWSSLKSSISETVQLTTMIMFMFIGAYILLSFLTITNLPDMLGKFLTGLALPRMWILIGILFLYIVLGCFLDIFAAIILTSPIIFPAVTALGYDLVWFGVLMVRIMEIGMITPPIGLNVFILSGTTGVPVGTIFRGVIPFLIADILHVTLLIFIPSLSLFLIHTMQK